MASYLDPCLIHSLCESQNSSFFGGVGGGEHSCGMQEYLGQDQTCAIAVTTLDAELLGHQRTLQKSS